MPRICYTPKRFTPEHEAIIRRANEIINSPELAGYDLTLRQLYYQFVARDLIPNTVQSYKRLGSILNDARLAGRLDWSSMVDRTRNLADLAHWSDVEDIVAAIAAQFRLARWDYQPHRVEIWVEKEALAGIVQRIAARLDCPWIACRGYMSQSEQWTAAQRIRAHLIGENHKDRRGNLDGEGQSVTILHLGDHDPSGIDMSRDNEDRLRLFIAHDYVADNDDQFPGDSFSYEQAFEQIERTHGSTFEFRRIALTYAQVEEVGPPPNPAKLTDSRADGYIRAHGRESWELDALNPQYLDDLTTSHVEPLRDETLWDEISEQQAEGRRLLSLASNRWDDVVALLEADDS